MRMFLLLLRRGLFLLVTDSEREITSDFFYRKRNGMLHHSLGGAVIFISLQHFIAPSLKLMLCLSVCLVFLLPACPPDVGGRQ